MNLAKNSKFKPPTGYVINPVGFILGARVINKDNQIDKNRLNMTLSQFQSTLKTGSIIAEDIVRYGRYWMTLL